MVTAIFFLLVLAALGAFMVTTSGVQQATASQSAVAARAYYGAKAGLEWGIQRAIAAGACAPSTPFSLAGPGLDGVSVTVTCASTTHPGGNVYRITSQAQHGSLASPGYAERRMEATVSNIP